MNRKRQAQMRVRVVLLDDTYRTYFIDVKSSGKQLLDTVFDDLNLLERDFFSLRYVDKQEQLRWLQPHESVKKQLKVSLLWTCYFCVKYYVADPCTLQEEISRYFFCLQLRRDVYHCRLLVTHATAVHLFAYILQSEFGDYGDVDEPSSYFADFQLLPENSQTQGFEREVIAQYQTLTGLVPSQAEMSFLEHAKWLPLYGIDLHSARALSGIDLQIGVGHSGISIFQKATRLAFFHWPKISKIQFRRRYFGIQTILGNLDDPECFKYKFLLDTERAAKELWRCCVEQHCFFRRIALQDDEENIDGSRPGLLRRCSSRFRYSGRTECQVRQWVRRQKRSEPSFSRVPRCSFRNLPTEMEFPERPKPWTMASKITMADNPRSSALKPSIRRLASGSFWVRLPSPLRRKQQSLRRAKPVWRRGHDSETLASSANGHAVARRSQSAPNSWHLAVFREKGFRPEVAKRSTEMMRNRPGWFFTPVESSQRRSMAWTSEDVDRMPQQASTMLSPGSTLERPQQRRRYSSSGTTASEDTRHIQALSALDPPDGHAKMDIGSGQSGRDEWLWSPRVTVAEGVSPVLNDDYMEEESVSDEAHKRFLQELWAQSGVGESPPPIDLGTPVRESRSNRSSKRRVKSWFLNSTSTGGEFRPENPALTRVKLSVDSPPSYGYNTGSDGFLSGRNNNNGSFRSQGHGQHMPSSGSGHRRLGSSSRDRRVSVLGLPLFTAPSVTDFGNRGTFQVTDYDQNKRRRTSQVLHQTSNGHAPLAATSSLPLTNRKCVDSSGEDENDVEFLSDSVKSKGNALKQRKDYFLTNGIVACHALHDNVRDDAFRNSGCEWLSTGSDDVFGSVQLDNGIMPDKHWFESNNCDAEPVDEIV